MTRQLPKAEISPKLPSAADFPIQASELGRILPIVYGAARVAANIIERDDNQTASYASTTQAAGATTAIVGSAIVATTLCQTFGQPRQLLRLVQGSAQYNIRYQSWAGSTFTLASRTGRTATAGTTTTSIVDSGATFITWGILAGDLVRNITRGLVGYVVAVVSETQITVALYTGLPITAQASGDSYELNTIPVATAGTETFYAPVVPTAGTPAQTWRPSHTYAANDLIWSSGLKYVCTTGGVSQSAINNGSGPSGTGSGISDGTCVWACTTAARLSTIALAVCEGQIFGIGQAWQDSIQFAAYASLPSINIALFLGAAGGLTRPGWFAGNVPQPPYGNTAVLMLQSIRNDTAQLPSFSLEVQGLFASGTVDVNPTDVAIDLITHARRGAALASTRVDAVTTGAAAASWRTYATAFGLNVSWLIDTQTMALELLRQLLEATNTEAIWTNRLDGQGGMLKFLPLGDTALTANGVTFTPNTTAAYSLSEDDYLEPIQVTHVPPWDTFNSCPVEYVDRASGYMRLAVDDPDMADVDLRGLKRAPTRAYPQVMSPSAAIMMSRILAQRSLLVRNTYRIKIGWRFLLLEPGDILLLSDTVLGLSQQRVRITAIEEDQSSGAFIVTALDWTGQVYAAASYTPQPVIRS